MVKLPAVPVTGTGNDDVVSSTAVTLTASAQASVSGDYNTVSLAASSSLSLNGTANSVMASGNNATMTDTTGSSSNSFTLTGAIPPPRFWAAAMW